MFEETAIQMDHVKGYYDFVKDVIEGNVEDEHGLKQRIVSKLLLPKVRQHSKGGQRKDVFYNDKIKIRYKLSNQFVAVLLATSRTLPNFDRRVTQSSGCIGYAERDRRQ